MEKRMFSFFRDKKSDFSFKIRHSAPLDPATLADLCAGVDDLCRGLSAHVSKGDDPVLRARLIEARPGSIVLGFVIVSLNGLAAANPAAFALITGVMSAAVWKTIEYVARDLASKGKGALSQELIEALSDPSVQAALRKVFAIHKDESVESLVVDTKTLPALEVERNDLAAGDFALSFAIGDPRAQKDETLWAKHARIVRVADAGKAGAEWEIWFDWHSERVQTWVKAPNVPDALNWAPEAHRTIVADLRVHGEDAIVGKSGLTKRYLRAEILRMLWGETETAPRA